MDSKSAPRQVELIFNATKLQGGSSSQNPYLKVFYIDNDNTYRLLGETESQKSDPNPKWIKTFKMEFILSKRQNLRFEIWDKCSISSDKQIGTCECTLAQIITDQTNNYHMIVTDKNNKDIGNLFTRAGNVGTNCVQWTWSARKLKNMDTFSKSDPLMRLWFITDDKSHVFIRESETIMDNNDPTWARYETSLSLLCRSDLNREFKIEVKDWEQSGNYKFIGKVNTSIAWLLNNPNSELELHDENNKTSGYLKCHDIKLIKPEFVDFLIGGQQINILAAIDFTASNGDYTESHSLHCLDLSKNQYLITLQTVADVLLDYDYDKKISLFGFGGVPNFPNLRKYDTDHCFNLTGNPNEAEVAGMQGIISTYQEALKNVTLCGPTYFQEVLRKGIEYAKARQNQNVYTILLILTDGVIDDLEESKMLLSLGGELPFSVVIVGVGNDKFLSMKELDGPDVKNLGQVSFRRDCCNFLKFNDYKKDHKALLDQILKEIPDQLTSYKRQHNVQVYVQK